MLRATANSESPPGSLVYADAVKQAEAYINEHSDQVVFGGETDVSRLLVEPTVIVHDSDMELNPPEFFSPVFCIAPYDDVADLEAWANTEWESARGMYAAVFGESQLNGPRLGTAVVLRDQTTFDHEDGNKPFGGYGVSANSVRLGISVCTAARSSCPRNSPRLPESSDNRVAHRVPRICDPLWVR
ncbi:aldehyde dehydrogenase family protein [Actinomadura sp. J1-007]|uniref:aldehyde dehydrogenase family protein n=1 Tax=Actinomadura sp. J1-007 TaxID=2661913 RepID=UPI00132290ED|nr:aldehyde dehydrogenase family protein [Actinomadura sp. J1-007]MWK37151.1 aldehyde dehydrogenase family protein [Actinomadura sp. J1-007]